MRRTGGAAPRAAGEISRRTQLELQALFCWALYVLCYDEPNRSDAELAHDASPMPALTEAIYEDAGEGYPGWRGCLDLLHRRR